MTNIKDKLSASVRQARADQGAAPGPADESAAKPAVSKPAAASAPAAKQASSKPAAASVKTTNTIQESGSDLFPQRVWPD